MAVKIDIKKKLGSFTLNLKLETDCRRIGILGASGCGKSMTLKCVAGIEKPDSGIITVDGKTMFDSSAKCNWKPQKRKVGYLFQNYALFPTMTVRDNIAAGLKCGKDEKKAIVDRMLKKFQLEGLGNRLPGELSGGQQQRTALARIMAYEPDMILLDEPFSALDMFLKDRLQQELQEMLNDYEGTVILVSHNRDEIYQLCDELLIMDSGRDVCYGKTRNIFAVPEWKEAARLTGCKNIVPVSRIDAHTLDVPVWGIRLKLKREAAEDIRYAGLRAHDFLPIWEKETFEPGVEADNQSASEPGAEADNQSAAETVQPESGDITAAGCGRTGTSNRIKVRVKSMAELPSERKYFLYAQGDDAEEICWFIQRDEWEMYDRRGLPDYLEIPEDKVLLLKE